MMNLATGDWVPWHETEYKDQLRKPEAISQNWGQILELCSHTYDRVDGTVEKCPKRISIPRIKVHIKFVSWKYQDKYFSEIILHFKLMYTDFSLKESPASWKPGLSNHASISLGLMAQLGTSNESNTLNTFKTPQRKREKPIIEKNSMYQLLSNKYV